ncbi:hypothetical protein [Mesoplasma melaleucae]|uniref:hypothetical protein n=1 Tax=Mesoplasma melaleucae TaxID=81459 RepID=UPI0012EBEA8C|nr:hypothetical protein [Mesoplasma melaleucae]
MDWFQLNNVDSWNMNWTDVLGTTREYHNAWKIKIKSLNFISWKYKGNFDTSDWRNRNIKLSDIENGLKIPDSDWEAFDMYLNLMAKVDMKRGMINSLNQERGATGKSLIFTMNQRKNTLKFLLLLFNLKVMILVIDDLNN